MPLSKVAISNIALARLGADSIRSFSESNKRARMCDILFDSIRDDLLERFDWPFAKRFVQLNEVTITDPIPTGMVVYQLPNDCKKPRDIHPVGSKIPWFVQNNQLYTQLSEVYLYYTALTVDTALFSSVFANLLALGMASQMCMAITHDAKMAKQLIALFDNSQYSAWEVDANIGSDYQVGDSDPENDTFVNPDGSLAALNSATAAQ